MAMTLSSPKSHCKTTPLFLVLFLATQCSLCQSKCNFKAIFNFGDSNSDTGGFWTAFPAQSGPHGMTYFKKPVGRACDGRLMVDFLAQALGLPFLSPYLQSVRADLRHGANYATLASTALLPNTSLFVTGVSPFSLAIQLNQMKALKARVDEYHSTPQKDPLPLPSPDAIEISLYTLYIGQNDLALNFGAVDAAARQVASTIDWTLKELYDLGGRTFWILNVLPLGCSPSILLWLPENSTDLDSFGCSVTYNKKTEEFNKIMKEAITQTRQSLPKAHIIHVDIYSALLELFRHPTERGLKYGPKACGGYGGGKLNMDPRVGCGEKVDVNGTIVEAKACSDPENYVSWDGIHATDAANKLVTSAILNGSFFDPPFSIHQLCDLQPIG